MNRRMVLIGLCVIALLLAGCTGGAKDESVVEEDDSIDLSEYTYYMVELLIRDDDGLLNWTWDPIDPELCEREPARLDMYRVRSKANSWIHERLGGSTCGGNGSVEVIGNATIIDAAATDPRVFYHFKWTGVIRITYQIDY